MPKLRARIIVNRSRSQFSSLAYHRFELQAKRAVARAINLTESGGKTVTYAIISVEYRVIGPEQEDVTVLVPTGCELSGDDLAKQIKCLAQADLGLSDPSVKISKEIAGK